MTDDTLLLHEMSLSVSDGGCAFCGVTLQEYAIGGVTHQWPRGSKLRWYAAFDDIGGVRADDVKSAFTTALKEISDASDLFFAMTTSELTANLVIKLQRLDGKSGVLADCGIPVGNVGADITQLQMRLDTSEKWALSENPLGDVIDLYRVFLHEALHFCGLGHKPASVREPALIAPMYSASIRNLQSADKGELLRRYGPPKNPESPPSLGAIPQTIAAKIEVQAYGGIYIASGPMKRKPAAIVTPPVEMREDFHD